MNQTPDVELVLREFFADDGLSAPDNVLDVVEERISRQPRRLAWPVPRRPFVNTYAKLAAGVAAVLAIGVVGWQLLPGTTGPAAPTTAPTPTAQPTAAATAAPSAGARFPAWYPPGEIAGATGAGILTAGSHATRVFTPAFTYSVPDGWVNTNDDAVYFDLFPDSPANAAQFARSDGKLAQYIDGSWALHGSPVFTCESAERGIIGGTAAEKFAVITAHEALAVSNVVDVTIGGLSGKQFDVQRNPDWTGTCPGDSDLPAGVDPEDERTRCFLLDVTGRVRGVLVLFLYSVSSAEHEAFLAEAMPIVESFEFDLGQ